VHDCSSHKYTSLDGERMNWFVPLRSQQVEHKYHKSYQFQVNCIGLLGYIHSTKLIVQDIG